MLKPLVTILLMLAIAGPAIGGETAPGNLVKYKTRGEYEMVRESLEFAITGQGLVISGTLHVQEMLDRTAPDLGIEESAYHAAESFEFCSAVISHLMIQADPANLAVCPFTVSVYQLTGDQEHVYVAYRVPTFDGDSAAVEKKALKLLDDIAREAVE
jgi:uncharacterized protein (DUF302 family)